MQSIEGGVMDDDNVLYVPLSDEIEPDQDQIQCVPEYLDELNFEDEEL